MPRFRVVTLCLLLTLGLFLSCTDGDGPVSFEAAGLTTVLQIQPIFPRALLSSAAEAKPINLIRVTVTTDPAGVVVNTQDFNVSPNAASWEVPVEIPLSDDPAVRFVITIELINLDNGVEETQWSAQTEPLTVTAGSTPEVRQIEVVRGPVDNLEVVSLTLTGPASVLQDEGFTLTASVQTSGNAATPTVFWRTLRSEIASITDNGSGRALAPGTARIEAVAGPITTVFEFEVIGVAAGIEITPGTARVSRLDKTVDFEATVVDSRGVATAETVTWEVADERIAENLGDGRFRSIGGGETTVTATGVESPRLSATATLLVDLPPVTLELSPSSLRLTSLGQGVTLEAVGVDAEGTRIFGLDVEFSARDRDVATVDRNGFVIAIGTGQTVVTATFNAAGPGVSGSGGRANSGSIIEASAEIIVEQEVALILLTPDQATVDRIDQTVQFRATAFDARDNPVPNPALAWRSGDTSIARVDDSGLATAVGRGATEIFVSSGGVETSAGFAVDISVAEIVVHPTVAFTGPGGTVQFSAELLDENGAPITGLTVDWASSRPELVTIDADGLATGVANGETRISAGFAGLFGSARMFVQDLIPTQLAFRNYPTTTAVNDIIAPVEVSALTADGRLASTYEGMVTITLEVPVLAPGALVQPPLFEGTLTVQARSGVAVFNDLRVNQTGTYSFTATSPDRLTAARGADFVVAVPTADLAVTKSVSPTTQVGEGGAITWRVTVTNNGPFSSGAIRIFDNDRTFWTLDNFQPSVGQVLVGASTEWEIPDLAVGQSATLTVNGFANGALGDSPTNSAGVSSTTIADPVGTNDVGQASLTIAAVDIALAKVVDNPNPVTGDAVTFTLTVTNNGPVPATNVVILDREPPSYTITRVALSKGILDQVTETWTIDVLAPGESATLEATVTILALAGATVTNTGSLQSVDQTDTNAANDTVTVSFTVNTPPVVPNMAIAVPPNATTTILVPISDADADNIVTGTIVSGPSNGGVGAVTINSNTEAQFTYTPNGGFLGVDNVTLTVTDVHGATSAVGAVDITVATGPLPASYETGGNTELVTGAFVRPGTGHVFNPAGVLALTPGLTVTTVGAFTSTQGGAVQMQADGSFSYKPAFLFKGTDTFGFTVDSGQSQTVTIVVSEMVWFVNNLAGPGAGTGTSWDPFGELAMTNGPSQMNDVIFLHTGDGTTLGYNQGITLLTRQSLFGEGMGLIADGMNGAPNWGVVVPAGAPPVITNPLGAGVVMGIESDGGGFTIDGAATGVLAAGATDFHLFTVNILNTVGDAVQLNGVGGLIGLENVNIDGAANGIALVGGAPMINYTGSIANTTVQAVHTSGTTGGGLSVTNGPVTWSVGGGLLMDNSMGRVQMDNARSLLGADRAVLVTNSAGDLFMNGLEIDFTTLNAIEVTNYSGSGVITLAGGNFPNNAARAIQVHGISAGAALVIDGPTLIEESGLGFQFWNIDGHLGVVAPTIIRNTGFGVGLETLFGTGTIDLPDLTVDMTASAIPVAPGGFDARYADWEMFGGIQNAAVNIQSPSGTITFGNLHLKTDNEMALVMSGLGSGTIQVTGPSSTIDAAGNSAVVAIGVNLNMDFADVSATSSIVAGIRVQNSSGNFNATAGALTNNAGAGVEIVGGTVMFNYGGTITTPIGLGASVVISSSSGNASFNGLIQEQGGGILLLNNPGAKTSFNGGLSINTSAGTGFKATNGGGIEVTGPGNPIDVVGQVAIDLNDSPVGPAGITFESISSNGSPTSGISIVNPPPPAPPAPVNGRNRANLGAPRLVSHSGLTVTGTGGPGSGGLINNSGGDGISLVNSILATFNSLDVQNSTGHGINISDPRGRTTIDGANVTGNGAAGVNISNSAGSGHVVVQNSTVSGNGVLDAPRGSGIRHEALPAASGATTLLISNNTISNNPQAGVDLGSDGTQTVDAKIEGNTMNGNGLSGLLSGALGSGSSRIRALSNILSGSGGGSGEVTVDGNASTDFIAQNNTITNNGAGFILQTKPGSTSTATLNATITGNTIDGVTSGGIGSVLGGNARTRQLISNNPISNILGGSGSGSDAGTSFGSTADAHVTITGNTFDAPNTGTGQGITYSSSESALLCLRIGDGTNASLQNILNGQASITGSMLSLGAKLLIQGITALTADPNVVTALIQAFNPTATTLGLTLATGAQVGPGTCELPPALPPFVPII